MLPTNLSNVSSGDQRRRKEAVSVIIPSWNTLDLTRNCLQSLFEADHGCVLQVIVIDNGSADGSPELIARDFPDVVLLRNERNEYYSRACNQGARLATSRFLCFLNSDTEVPSRSIEKLSRFLNENPDYGAVAPRLDNLDGSVQAICRRFPTLMEVVVDQFALSWWGPAQRYRARAAMRDFDHLSSRDVEQPPGACFVMERDYFERLGGFDESLPLFYSDVDICLRIWRSGRRIRFLSEATVFHVGSASVVRHPLWRGEFMRNQVRYYRKHRGWLAAQFARFVIVLSALRTAAFTALGRRNVADKARILRDIFSSVRTAVSG